MPHEVVTQELHAVGPQELGQRPHLCGEGDKDGDISRAGRGDNPTPAVSPRPSPVTSENSAALKGGSPSRDTVTKACVAGARTMAPVLAWRSRASRYLGTSSRCHQDPQHPRATPLGPGVSPTSWCRWW